MDGMADAALGMGGISLMGQQQQQQQLQQQQLLYQQQLQHQQQMLSHLQQGGGGGEGTNDVDFQQFQTPVPAAAAAEIGGNVLLPVHRTSLHQRLVQAVVPKSPSKFMSWQKEGASALPIPSPGKAAAADGAVAAAAAAAAPGSGSKQAGATRPSAGASSSRNLWR